MSYTFRAMSDEEIEKSMIVEKGEYQFEVVSSKRKISQSGNDMAEINIKFWDKDGLEHYINDYLVFIDKPLAIRKISHFCKSVGLEEQYKKGEIPEDLENHSGFLLLGIREEQPKGDGTFYPKKNIVVDYIKGEIKINPLKNNENEPFNDDVPF